MQAFFGAFLSYYLIKIVPFWGMSLIATSVLFLSPLIYKTNKELIDHHVKNASDIVNEQTRRVKQLASHHAARATEYTKQSVGDYSAKAQELVANARGRSTSPVATIKSAKTENSYALKNEDSSTAITAPVNTESAPAYKHEDFPAAPKDEFKSTPVADEFVSNDLNSTGESQPLISA